VLRFAKKVTVDKFLDTASSERPAEPDVTVCALQLFRSRPKRKCWAKKHPWAGAYIAGSGTPPGPRRIESACA
jgi:hypothetical protein